MALYELVNPSDRVTLKADTFEGAVLATILVGGGHYAAEPITEGAKRVPIFLLGGFDEWFAETFPEFENLDALLIAKRADAITSLRSFVLGNRDDFEAGAKHAPDRGKFRREWNERKRTSMNDIAGRADELASLLEQKAEESFDA